MAAQRRPEPSTDLARALADVTKFCLALSGGDPHEANDLVQTTGERLLRRTAKGDVRDLSAFARQVALNESRRRHRWRTSRRETELDAAVAVTSNGDIDATLDKLVLHEQLRRLSRRQREAVILHYLEDLPIAACSSLMGCSEGATKRYAHEGISRLRDALLRTDVPT